MFEAHVYRERRSALLRALGALGVSDGLVLLPGNGESPMNYAANAYPFRQDSTFLYFFGISRPGLAALLDLARGEAVLYGDDHGIDDVIWTGPQPTVAELAEQAGVAASRPRSALAADAGAVAVGKAGSSAAKPLLYLPPYRADVRAELAALSGMPYAEVDRAASTALVRAVVGLRELKSAAEIAELDAAVAISVDMHKAAMTTARAGMLESDVAARVSQVALSAGALAFPVIGTTKGATLHNLSRGNRLEEGELFLLDAGAETARGYAGDLTSTFPVGKRFDERQLEIYRVALAAQAAAISLLRPGRPFLEVHLAAARAIASGLRELGLMKGDVDEAVAAGAHALFFPHGIGHQIGLDVHDMENLGEAWVGYDGAPRSGQFGLAALRLAKPLKAGMAHSVEPGIYFIPRLIELWRAEDRFEDFIAYDRLGPWTRIEGVRVEEDWLVTPEGARRLGPAFDKSPAAVEALRA